MFYLHCNPVQGQYKASTGPEQGFPCVVFPHREKLHRENPVFITGIGLQFIELDIYIVCYFNTQCPTPQAPTPLGTAQLWVSISTH